MSIYSGPNPNLRSTPSGVPNLAVPEGSPSLFIDFVNNQYETVNNGIKTASSNAMSLITFTRSSNAFYTAANGTIQYVANNIPRFDYDPLTGYCKGLLIEEQRTNLSLYSQQFNLSWGNFDGTTVANTAVAPDGTLTATKLIAMNNGNEHILFQSLSLATNTYTFSAYLKAAEYSTPSLRLDINGTNQICIFNLITGTISYTSPVHTANIVAVGNGWYRCSVTGNTTGLTYYGIRSINGVGNDINGVYIWGAQLEAGYFPTSYIPTTATTVTRAADLGIISGSNFGWINNLTGTLFAEAIFDYVYRSPVDHGFLAFNNQYFGYNGMFLRNNAGVLDNGTPNRITTPYGGILAVPGGYTRMIMGWYGSSSFVSMNGSISYTASGSAQPTRTSLYMFATEDVIYARRLAFYPAALSSNSCQQVTS